MAQRRLFSPDIVESDAFLDMPVSTQALYFHLGMHADDDGFVNPKRVMRMIGAPDDDLKILLGKRFVLTFESGVIVIKHWRIHNSIRKDRYNETKYLEEKKTLILKENGSYTEDGNQLATKRQPVGKKVATQVKVSKGKVSKGKEDGSSTELSALPEPTPSQDAVNFFSKGENYVKTVEWLKSKGVPDKLINVELEKFILWWTEKNSTGKKERWQMEKTFEVKRRLATWLSRVKEFSGVSKKFPDSQEVDNFSKK